MKGLGRLRQDAHLRSPASGGARDATFPVGGAGRARGFRAGVGDSVGWTARLRRIRVSWWRIDANRAGRPDWWDDLTTKRINDLVIGGSTALVGGILLVVELVQVQRAPAAPGLLDVLVRIVIGSAMPLAGALVCFGLRKGYILHSTTSFLLSSGVIYELLAGWGEWTPLQWLYLIGSGGFLILTGLYSRAQVGEDSKAEKVAIGVVGFFSIILFLGALSGGTSSNFADWLSLPLFVAGVMLVQRSKCRIKLDFLSFLGKRDEAQARAPKEPSLDRTAATPLQASDIETSARSDGGPPDSADVASRELQGATSAWQPAEIAVVSTRVPVSGNVLPDAEIADGASRQPLSKAQAPGAAPREPGEQPTPVARQTVTDQLAELSQLRSKGHLTDEEFAKAKALLLGLGDNSPA